MAALPPPRKPGFLGGLDAPAPRSSSPPPSRIPTKPLAGRTFVDDDIEEIDDGPVASRVPSSPALPTLQRGASPAPSGPPPQPQEQYGLDADVRAVSGPQPPTLQRGAAPPPAAPPPQQAYNLNSVLQGPPPPPGPQQYGLGPDMQRAGLPPAGPGGPLPPQGVMQLPPPGGAPIFTPAPSMGGAPPAAYPPQAGGPQQFIPPPVFTLDQLPPEPRVVQLTPIQANDLVGQLQQQAHFTGAPPPKMVDLDDAHRAFMNSLGSERLAYVHTMEQAVPGGRFPLNCKPSMLQTKLKGGQLRLQDLVAPIMEPGQQGFVDLAYSHDGALMEEQARVWQFGMTLVKAEGVGPTGLREVRNPCLFVARIGLFDRANNRFLGNVLGVRPEAVVHKDRRWEFNPKDRVLMRCNCVQADPRSGTRLVNDDALSLYIEFNTSYRLDIADTKNMPNSETKASKMVDEVTSAWAMVSFRKCCQVGRDMEVSVPLYYGSLYDPQLLDAMYKAERKAAPLGSLLRPKQNPVLVFRVGPLLDNPPPLLPYGFLPSTMLALEDLAIALGAFRATLALQLARQHSAFSAVSDPVLAAFPRVLGDHHLLMEFLVKWRDATTKLSYASDAGCLSPQLLPPIAVLIEAFRRCVAEVAPLLHCTSLPPKHINNFVEYQGHRLKLVQQFCHVIDPRTNTVVGARHPVEPLSHAGFEFLHKPFDVAEVRVCMGDRLEKGPNFLHY